MEKERIIFTLYWSRNTELKETNVFFCHYWRLNLAKALRMVGKHSTTCLYSHYFLFWDRFSLSCPNWPSTCNSLALPSVASWIAGIVQPGPSKLPPLKLKLEQCGIIRGFHTNLIQRWICLEGARVSINVSSHFKILWSKTHENVSAMKECNHLWWCWTFGR